MNFSISPPCLVMANATMEKPNGLEIGSAKNSVAPRAFNSRRMPKSCCWSGPYAGIVPATGGGWRTRGESRHRSRRSRPAPIRRPSWRSAPVEKQATTEDFAALAP